MRKLSSLVSIVIILTLWHVLSANGLIDDQFFPSPFHFFEKLYQLLKTSTFLLDIRASLLRLSLASIMAIPSAYIFALLCTRYKFFDKLFNPIIAFTYPLPKVALIPLLLLIFGIGDSSKIAVIFLGMFYLLFIQLRVGMKSIINSKLADLIYIYKIKNFNYFYHILLRGTFLHFLIGLKTALGYGLTLVVVSEFSMSKDGIGNFIWKSWDQFRVLDVYAGISALSILGFIIYSILDYFIEAQGQKSNF